MSLPVPLSRPASPLLLPPSSLEPSPPLGLPLGLGLGSVPMSRSWSTATSSHLHSHAASSPYADSQLSPVPSTETGDAHTHGPGTRPRWSRSASTTASSSAPAHPRPRSQGRADTFIYRPSSLSRQSSFSAGRSPRPSFSARATSTGPASAPPSAQVSPRRLGEASGTAGAHLAIVDPPPAASPPANGNTYTGGPSERAKLRALAKALRLATPTGGSTAAPSPAAEAGTSASASGAVRRRDRSGDGVRQGARPYNGARRASAPFVHAITPRPRQMPGPLVRSASSTGAGSGCDGAVDSAPRPEGAGVGSRTLRPAAGSPATPLIPSFTFGTLPSPLPSSPDPTPAADPQPHESVRLPPLSEVLGAHVLGFFSAPELSGLYSPLLHGRGRHNYTQRRPTAASTPAGYVYDRQALAALEVPDRVACTPRAESCSMADRDGEDGRAVGRDSPDELGPSPLNPVPPVLPMASFGSMGSLGSFGSLPDLTTSTSQSETSFAVSVGDTTLGWDQGGEDEVTVRLEREAGEGEEKEVQSDAQRPEVAKTGAFPDFDHGLSTSGWAGTTRRMGKSAGSSARSESSLVLPRPSAEAIADRTTPAKPASGSTRMNRLAQPQEAHDPLADLGYWSALLLSGSVDAASSINLGRSRRLLKAGSGTPTGREGAWALKLEKEHTRFLVLRQRVEVFCRGWEGVERRMKGGEGGAPGVEVGEQGEGAERETKKRREEEQQRWDEVRGLVGRLRAGIEWLDLEGR